MTRYIFVTGGVVSSLGKGIASASLAALLQAHGYTVKMRKLDPYLNIDPGTMSPFQHGEVFVTEDGAETDLDLGHYERFTGIPTSRHDNVTTGQLYDTLLRKERRGDYLGKTVQVIPHITDLIKDFMTQNTDDADFVFCEIGGTVGDIEALPFFEAIRQVRYECGINRTLCMHLTLVPYISSAEELKTKPTQHSVKELRSVGINPDIIVCRSEYDVSEAVKEKIALFSDVSKACVISAPDVSTVYSVPIAYHEQGFDEKVLQHFNMPLCRDVDLKTWHAVVEKTHNASDAVTIAIVGKYNAMTDAYKSLVEALIHAGIACGIDVKLMWIDARDGESQQVCDALRHVDGVLVPAGFGTSGVENKIQAIQYAREHNIPFFGICFGMQLSVIEAARNLAGISHANSTEICETPEPVVARLEEWMSDDGVQRRKHESWLGGTMRLGAYTCALTPGTRARESYGADVITERHRHRFEVNSVYRQKLEQAGAVFSGTSADGELLEILEHPYHSWFVAVQFHPEFVSRPYKPHPLFIHFIRASKAAK